ncbi:unnamed protein product [Paramecium sonneborni]|uniref:Uncharacterized protein n=1 Tax=Paramecium sonneborni TaxID=65129 RepID=A0A8S1R186_9CILI|nr:unnamed protein product [Paramecium sonneborni]
MSDSSSNEDYRKLNRKAKKSQVRTNVQDPESTRFAQDFAQRLLKERGFDITEEEMGFKKQATKQVKATTYVHSIDQATFKELQKEFNKCENIGQICTILKALSNHKEATPQQQLQYKIQRSDFLIKNRMYEETKTECFELLQQELGVLEKVKVLLSLCKAQLETNEIYNGCMQALRLKSYAETVKLMPAFNLGIYDLTPEQIYKQIDDIYQNTIFKIQRDNKKVVSLLGVQGNSATGCLGQGDLNQCSELTQYQIFKNRKILSIGCGEHHVIILISGCSCINPHYVNQCKGDKCNNGNEVFGWGENFLGQVTMNEQDGNFVNVPYNISQLSNKNIIGVQAYKCTSLAWDSEGHIYQWGAKHILKIDSMTDIQQIVLGFKFGAILAKKSLFIIGELDENIKYSKLTKLADNIDQIACGDNHLISLNSEGEVWGIGQNNFHQLGVNNHLQYSQIQEEECFYINANQNSSVFVTSDGEVLYCGQVSREKVIDYPKTLQIDEDVQIIQACIYDGVIYALNLQGKIFKWDIDKEPKSKLFFSAPVRQLYLCRGIRLCETTTLQGEWCRLELEDQDQEQFETFTDINLIINLGDKYGPYGIKQTHPIRYNILVSEDSEYTPEQLLHKCQVVSMSKIQSQQENKIYLNFMNDGYKAEIKQIEEPSKHKLVLQVNKPGTYLIYLYLNEQLLIDCPLNLNLIAGSRQDELIQAEELKKQQQQAELQRKQALLLKKQQEEEERQRLLNEQQQELLLKQQETKKRADEKLQQYQLKMQEEKRIKEEERQQKKDLLTGGGFDLNKVKQQQESNQNNNPPKKIIKQVNTALTQKVRQQMQNLQQERQQLQSLNNQQQQEKQQNKHQSQPQKLNPVKATPKVLQSIQSNKTTDKAFSTQETFKEFQQTGQFRKTDSQLQKMQQEFLQEFQQLKRQETNKYKR